MTKKVARLDKRLRLREQQTIAAEDEKRTRKWLMEIGIPMMKKDFDALVGRVKVKREARNAAMYEALEQAAQLAELTDEHQTRMMGYGNTGGAALTARVIRAWAQGLKDHLQR